jgi:hypothetical protein
MEWMTKVFSCLRPKEEPPVFVSFPFAHIKIDSKDMSVTMLANNSRDLDREDIRNSFCGDYGVTAKHEYINRIFEMKRSSLAVLKSAENRVSLNGDKVFRSELSQPLPTLRMEHVEPVRRPREAKSFDEIRSV